MGANRPSGARGCCPGCAVGCPVGCGDGAGERCSVGAGAGAGDGSLPSAWSNSSRSVTTLSPPPPPLGDGVPAGCVLMVGSFGRIVACTESVQCRLDDAMRADVRA